jgi:hypothetical protein
MRIITDSMLLAVKGNPKDVAEIDKIDFNDFRKFLDLNPAIRQIIQEALKPTLWTISESKPGVNERGAFGGCIAPTRSVKKLTE